MKNGSVPGEPYMKWLAVTDLLKHVKGTAIPLQVVRVPAG